MDTFGLTIIHEGLHRTCVLHSNLVQARDRRIKGVWVIVLCTALKMHEFCHTSLEFIDESLASFVRSSRVQVILTDVTLAILGNRVLSSELMLDTIHCVQVELLFVHLK